MWSVRSTVPPFRVKLLGLAVLLAAPVVAAGPPPKQAAQARPPTHGKTAKLEPAARRTTPGRSIGSPTDGHLIGGARLPDAPHLRIVPVYVEGDARWGLEPLVGMIDRAGRAIRKRFPDSVLSVGHLSRPGGGNIERHASHESGRDADIGFYVKNQQGKSIYADHFVPFKGDGTAPSWPGALFDDEKNWALVASLVGDSAARVTYIFVATPLRARLLQYAEKIGAPPALRTRAAELMAQPRGSLPHDDHFHVRIACPVGMDKCVERPLPRRHPYGALAKSPGRSKGHEHAEAKGRGPAPGPKDSQPSTRRRQESAPPPAAPPRERVEESEKAENSRSEPLVPSLAPMVPGLDTVIIPAPLVAPSEKSEVKPAPAPIPAPLPIDDPDGVLSPR